MIEIRRLTKMKRKKTKQKKSQGLSLNIVVMAALALVVLIVLIIIFSNRASHVSNFHADCENKGGEIVDIDKPCQEDWVATPFVKSGDKKCCISPDKII
jgi:hypothetical protein